MLVMEDGFGFMSDLTQLLLLTLIAGLAMPAGALLARFEHLQSHWLELELRHSVMAFGGGALLSAVALVLVPEGIAELSPWLACCCFIGGALLFMALDIWLARQQSPASQLTAMLADFLPESMALGASLAAGGPHAFLLALLITLQNIPEGFNAFREIRQSKQHSAFAICVSFTLMALLGPVAGLIGYFVLAEHPAMLGGIMLLAAGGILYSVFQDIAPQVRLKQHWSPPLGAVAGFMLGMLGYMYS